MHTDGLAERALDQIDLVQYAVPFGDTGAARAVHADRVHFVEIGYCVEFMGEIADFLDQANIAVH